MDLLYKQLQSLEAELWLKEEDYGNCVDKGDVLSASIISEEMIGLKDVVEDMKDEIDELEWLMTKFN